jgi:glycosyltransferase involved in cell wall biosynthesis
MPRPLVSVVVPVYNGAKYLSQALDSALGQTYRPLQVVVVDDGSTDSSPEAIASYGARIVSIRQPNAGVAAARNVGIRSAGGDLIAFLDQDDWWLPEKVERQVAVFSEDEGLGLVHTGVAQYSDEEGRFVNGVYDTSKSAGLQGSCYDTLLLGNGVFNSSTMIRRSVLASSGLFDPGIPGNTVQDYDLWVRIARDFRFGYIPEPLAVLRLHPAQGSRNRREMLNDELRLLERRLGADRLRATAVMRARVATLLGELGVAYLDADNPRAARRCFRRAFGMCWSSRAAVLYAVCLFPPRAVAWLRWLRARWVARHLPPATVVSRG